MLEVIIAHLCPHLSPGINHHARFNKDRQLVIEAFDRLFQCETLSEGELVVFPILAEPTSAKPWR
jgi:hypothetical protein